MSYFLISIITSIVLTALFATSRNAKPVKTENGGLLLLYPKSLKLFAITISTLILVGLLLISVTVSVQHQEDLTSLVLLWAFGLAFSAYFIIETFTVSVLVNEIGIISKSGWRGSREYSWSEVEFVTYSPISMYFKIKGKGKPSLRISGMHSGIVLFQKYYMDYLPETKWLSAYEAVKKDKRIPIS